MAKRRASYKKPVEKEVETTVEETQEELQETTEVENIEEVTETEQTEPVTEETEPEETTETEDKEEAAENEATEEVQEESEQDAMEPTKKQDKPAKRKKLTMKQMTGDLKELDLNQAVNYGKNFPELKAISESVERYIEKYNSRDGDTVARLHYDLYINMNNIINESDYNTFSLKFKYLSLLVCRGTKGPLSELRMHKFDFNWKWGSEERNRYSKLVTLLHVICERGAKNTARVIDPDKLVSKFGEKAKTNLKNYITA